MTTNVDHLNLAAVALLQGGPTPELLDDLEACITLVRHERFQAVRSRRGRCSRCGLRQRLRVNGTVQSHWGQPVDDWSFECSGTGRLPA